MSAPPLPTSSLSTCTTLTFRPPNLLLLLPTLSRAPSHSYFHQCFRFDHRTTPYETPTLICHAKLDGSGSEEHEQIRGEVFFEDNDDLMEDDSDDEDETDSSVDLLIRFLQSMFKKISRRAKKASRSVLPALLSPQLVSFAVDGILLLAALSTVKALVEVVCTLGSTVFVGILLLRVMWAAISFFQSSGNTLNQGGSSFGTTQPVA